MKTDRHTRWMKAQWAADEVLNGLDKPQLPIDPFAIAKARDIEVRGKDTSDPGVLGVLVYVAGQLGILYATHVSNEGFVRFTVAHELGHVFLDGHVEALFSNGHTVHNEGPAYHSENAIEEDADHFAACLLMPETLVRPVIEQVGHGIEAIKELSAKCKTSLTATAIRYAALSEAPVAVVLSEGKYVRTSWMSEAVRNLGAKGWIHKRSLVPSGTLTYRFNADPRNVSSARSDESVCSLSDWIDDAPDAKMNEDVIGLGSIGTTLTVLFPSDDGDEDADESSEADD